MNIRIFSSTMAKSNIYITKKRFSQKEKINLLKRNKISFDENNENSIRYNFEKLKKEKTKGYTKIGNTYYENATQIRDNGENVYALMRNSDKVIYNKKFRTQKEMKNELRRIFSKYDIDKKYKKDFTILKIPKNEVKTMLTDNKKDREKLYRERRELINENRRLKRKLHKLQG